MKNVLWISRHTMTTQQFTDLERVMQDSVSLIQWKGNVTDPAELEPLLSDVDAVAAVLPMELMAELWKKIRDSTREGSRAKPLLQAVSDRIFTGRTTILPDGRTNPETMFVHKGWQQIIHMDIRLLDL